VAGDLELTSNQISQTGKLVVGGLLTLSIVPDQDVGVRQTANTDVDLTFVDNEINKLALRIVEGVEAEVAINTNTTLSLENSFILPNGTVYLTATHILQNVGFVGSGTIVVNADTFIMLRDSEDWTGRIIMERGEIIFSNAIYGGSLDIMSDSSLTGEGQVSSEVVVYGSIVYSLQI